MWLTNNIYNMSKIKTLLLSVFSFLLPSCEHVSLESVEDQTTDPIQSKVFTFHLKGDFTTNYEEMTRALVRLENDNTADVTDLWVLDYQDGTLIKSIHQSKGDADFGHPQMRLSYGHHDVKLIASKGANPVLNSDCICWDKVRDTFALDYPIDVSETSNGNRAPELKRIISGVKFVFTDTIPSDACQIQVRMKRSLTLGIPELKEDIVTGRSIPIPIPTNLIYSAGGSFASYTLCTNDYTTDVTVTVLTKDNVVINEFTIKDVQLKQNRMTVLTGEAFYHVGVLPVSIDTSWEDPLTMTF